MGNLENIFERRLKQLGIKKQVDAAMVVEESQRRLTEIFGEKAENNLMVVSFNKGILKVAARTNTWAAECQGKVAQINKPPVERVVFEVNDFSN